MAKRVHQIKRVRCFAESDILSQLQEIELLALDICKLFKEFIDKREVNDDVLFKLELQNDDRLSELENQFEKIGMPILGDDEPQTNENEEGSLAYLAAEKSMGLEKCSSIEIPSLRDEEVYRSDCSGGYWKASVHIDDDVYLFTGSGVIAKMLVFSKDKFPDPKQIVNHFYRILSKDFIINLKSAYSCKSVIRSVDVDHFLIEGLFQLARLPDKLQVWDVIFGDYIWQLSQREKLFPDDELKYVLLEEIDKDRRKMEKLRKKFDSVESTEVSRQRVAIPEEVRIVVWRRDEGRCTKCGSNENLEYDHIIPWSKGGSNSSRNLQLLCQECNRSKSGNI